MPIAGETLVPIQTIHRFILQETYFLFYQHFSNFILEAMVYLFPKNRLNPTSHSRSSQQSLFFKMIDVSSSNNAIYQYKMQKIFFALLLHIFVNQNSFSFFT